MSLGENINRLRREKLMSQIDLADALDVSRQSVSKWESDSSTPELEKLLAMSELFGVSLDELVKGEIPAAAHQETKRTEEEQLYCLVLTESIFDKDTMQRLLCEDFGYNEEDAEKAIAEAPVVIKQNLRYSDADRIEREIREIAWTKILYDEDAWNPVAIREGKNVPPPDAPLEEEKSDGVDFWGLVIAVVVGVIIAVLLLSLC